MWESTCQSGMCSCCPMRGVALFNCGALICQRAGSDAGDSPDAEQRVACCVPQPDVGEDTLWEWSEEFACAPTTPPGQASSPPADTAVGRLPEPASRAPATLAMGESSPSSEELPAPGSTQPAVPVQQGDVNAVESKDLRKVVVELLSTAATQTVSLGELRKAVAEKLGVREEELAGHRQFELRSVVEDAFALLRLRQASPHDDDEREEHELGQEVKQALRRVYLTTLSHPQQEFSEDGIRLMAPRSFSREQVRDAFLEALAACQGNHASPLKFELMVVYRERHADGEIHYNVAIRASKQFRFGPLNKFLINKKGLPS